MYLCIRLNRTSFCSDSSSSHVYPGFRKTAAISPAISSYRHVAAVDPDTAGVENHRNKPQHTLLGVSVTFTTWRIGFPFLLYLQRQPFSLWSLCNLQPSFSPGNRQGATILIRERLHSHNYCTIVPRHCINIPT